MANKYLTTDELIERWRPLTPEEITRADVLIGDICAVIRYKAKSLGKDFEEMLADDEDLEVVAKSVITDIVSRELTSSTTDAALSQFSQSAGGYSISGTYLSAGGGLFIKKDEWKRLGLRSQKYGAMNFYV